MHVMELLTRFARYAAQLGSLPRHQRLTLRPQRPDQPEAEDRLGVSAGCE